MLQDFVEFTFANTVFHALAEGHASEMSARRTSMENATKNAGEMIDKLTMIYNRRRQASITNDLVDIITGASMLALILTNTFAQVHRHCKKTGLQDQ